MASLRAVGKYVTTDRDSRVCHVQPPLKVEGCSAIGERELDNVTFSLEAVALDSGAADRWKLLLQVLQHAFQI